METLDLRTKKTKKQKIALITGITGQDGYWLTQLLQEKGYEVHGIIRRNSQQSIGNLELFTDEEKNKIVIHWGDITDSVFVNYTIDNVKPDELYHLAAQSFVGLSFRNPELTNKVNIGGTLNVVNAIKQFSPETKTYFAASSEMFGAVKEEIQNEETPFNPQSPYAISKVAGYWTCKHYREAYNLFICNGILFNHESEVRGPEFVTRKITKGIAQIKKGKLEFLELGNLMIYRDWGYAPEYVQGMWLMLQQKEADDYVLATGKSISLFEFVAKAFHFAKYKVQWKGAGRNLWLENTENGKALVKISSEYYRPSDVERLCGDATKARAILGWEPKITVNELLKKMLNYDFKNSRR